MQNGFLSRTKLLGSLSCIAAFILGLTAVNAATIKLLPSRDGGPTIITVAGQLTLSDGEKFAEAISEVRHAVVILASPGGALIAGLQIGKVIRLHHFTTFVSQGDYCASACALAWLAGEPLVMQEGSRIGFHAAYIERGGVKVGANVGNALVGAYLSELGLSYAAIVYVESANPDDITWLTMRDAHRIGLTVRLLAPDTSPTLPAETRLVKPARPADPVAPKPSPPGLGRSPSLVQPELSMPAPDAGPERPIEEVAQSFVKDYFAHWSESGRQAMVFFQGAYAKQVTFYGKEIDRETVLAGKRGFTERWPARVYSTQPETVKVFCNQANRTCTVSGVVDWDCRNPIGDTSTKGSANFILTASLAGPRPEILAENGSVISRSTN